VANLLAALAIAEGGLTTGIPASSMADSASNRKATSTAPDLPRSLATRPSRPNRSVPPPLRARPAPTDAASCEKSRRMAFAPCLSRPEAIALAVQSEGSVTTMPNRMIGGWRPRYIGLSADYGKASTVPFPDTAGDVDDRLEAEPLHHLRRFTRPDPHQAVEEVGFLSVELLKFRFEGGRVVVDVYGPLDPGELVLPRRPDVQDDEIRVKRPIPDQREGFKGADLGDLPFRHGSRRKRGALG